MTEFSWNWDNLPKGIKEEIQQLVTSGNRKSLVKIHDRYNLSIAAYCCGSGPASCLDWFKWGLKMNKIK